MKKKQAEPQASTKPTPTKAKPQKWALKTELGGHIFNADPGPFSMLIPTHAPLRHVTHRRYL